LAENKIAAFESRPRESRDLEIGFDGKAERPISKRRVSSPLTLKRGEWSITYFNNTIFCTLVLPSAES
jgi:hypothetical protein